MRPYGMRPYGMRPYGMRPYGMRPYGMRPYGMRPYGMRPYGMRPYGMRQDEQPEDAPASLDPDEWAMDIAEMFCGSSAVIRLGGRLVFDVDDLPVPVRAMQNAAVYLPRTVAPGPSKDDDASQAVINRRGAHVQKVSDASIASLYQHRFRPRAYELVMQVAMRNGLVRGVAESPDVALALKQDIADALALRADQAFLHGNSDDVPKGIVERRAINYAVADGDLLKTVRGMVGELRGGNHMRFANAGWILHPRTLEQLTTLLTTNGLTKADAAGEDADTDAAGPGSSLDVVGSGQLLASDGADGGVLLGYPFVVSAAAAAEAETEAEGAGAGETRIYFSSDWSEAWISAKRPLVTVNVSADARFERDETVIRVVTEHDFALRTPHFFIYSEPLPA